MMYDSTNRKPYPKFPAYLVGKDGTIWRTEFRNRNGTKKLDIPRQSKPRIRSTYPAVGLWKNGKQTSESVHIMVLETFVGPRPAPNFQAAHLDGNPLNPRLENLQWTTKKVNNNHKRAHGTMPFGIKSGTAKLTDEDVIDIRAARKDGVMTHVLAERYGVANTTIRRAVNGQRWGHVKAHTPATPSAEHNGKDAL